MTAEILDMFTQPNMVEEWQIRLKTYIVPWVSKKGKSYWDIVRFHGHWHGDLKELTRPEFAKLIVSLGKDVLDNSDTESSLKENMQKFAHKDSLRKRSKAEKRQQCPNTEWRFELLPDTHACRLLVKELDDLYNQPIQQQPSSHTPTIRERLEEYLKSIVDEQRYAKVFSNPSYCGCTATLSVEQYVKQDFMDSRNPSHIVVYECTDERVDDLKVREYVGRYCGDSRIKLFICSPYGFDLHTQSVAVERNAGLMRVDPEYEITDDCYVVARSSELYAKTQFDYETLRGERKMSTPFVVYDKCGVTFSIADALSNHGIKIKPGLSIVAPRWTDDYIERRAMEIVRVKVDDFINKMHNYYSKREMPFFDANPEQLLADAGYDLEEADLSTTGQVALLNIKKRKVTIDISQNNNIQRRRYSLAHEYGHVTLHSNIDIYDFGESEHTLSLTAVASGYESKWLEHQANHFASCLLMPKDVVGYLYSFYCQKCFGRSVIHPITYGLQRSQQRDFYQIVTPMARNMNVSINALKRRLVKLDLLKVINTFNTPNSIMHSSDFSLKF